MKLQVGSIFAGHYLLKKTLGVGSFGEVWLAQNTIADIEVAIKIYKSWNGNGIEDFKEEFKLAYKLSHPNLLHINHFDIYENCPFLVMPYCKNGSAAKLMGKMSEEQIWTFIKDVSCGLMHLHSQYPPIIHQDIKPANILVGDNGHFLISDFGISTKLEQSNTQAKEQTSSGTIAYMAPEFFSTPSLVVKATDIWALGMSVYELATNELALNGMGGCNMINGETVPSLSTKYSYRLNDFVHKCLSIDTWERPTAQQAYEYAKRVLDSPSIVEPVSSKNSAPYTFSQSFSNNKVQTIHSSSSYSYQKQNTTYFKKHKEEIFWISLFIGLFVFSIFLFTILFNSSSKSEVEPTSFDSLDTIKISDEEFLSPMVIKKDSTFSTNIEKKERKKKQQVQQQKKDYPTTIQKTAIKKTPKINEEELFFRKCKTVFDYNNYINKYPKGKHIHEAKKRLRDKETEMMKSKNRKTIEPNSFI